MVLLHGYTVNPSRPLYSVEFAIGTDGVVEHLELDRQIISSKRSSGCFFRIPRWLRNAVSPGRFSEKKICLYADPSPSKKMTIEE